ncbi:MAG: respiratory nitrate reductase subunit gamma [Cryobacterium sp.]|nr:respiratory nitrate reductase subunit gamma [Micrococcales bacterium]MBX3078951.1 respiratory nitrate reductase subunit gamma [Cryobacterium sp.]MBX3311002.1 respiratory nitrate reductase subunit gamma [Cryobacterium sp.]HNP15151.1 respiratory nitrate reductase subunit gamma [Terrimesophilobacter sp.]
MTVFDVLLWVAFPYVAAASFIVGHILRYRYDKFGWTSRSSQTYESKWLRWGSPMFHYGILGVFAGHVVGLLIPREWLYFIGIDEHTYHLGATWLGTVVALITIAGIVILLARRGAVRRITRVTTVMDVVMYVFLAGALVLGTIAVIQFQVLGEGYDYRGTVSPWTRSLILFQPDASLMVGVPLIFQLHVLCSTALFLIWPYTRLVHVLSVPVWYLFRPYVVYRSRDDHRGARAIRRGWEKSPVIESKHPKQKQRVGAGR